MYIVTRTRTEQLMMGFFLLNYLYVVTIYVDIYV